MTALIDCKLPKHSNGTCEVSRKVPVLRICDPMDYKAPLSMEFSRQESWSGVPFPSPGDLLNQGIEPMSPSLQADALPSELPGKPQYWKTVSKNNNLLKTKIVRATLNGFFNFLDNFSKYFLIWKQGLSKFSCCQVASAVSNSL